MLTYTLFPVEGGFGYLVESSDGTFRVRQDTAPSVAGLVLMSEAEATASAQAVIAASEATTGAPDAVDAPVAA